MKHCHGFNFNSQNANCNGSSCKEAILCDHACFLLWDGNGTRISAGCGLETPKQTSNSKNATKHDDPCHSTCVADLSKFKSTARYYCCCTDDLCNYNYTIPEPPPVDNLTATTPAQPIKTQEVISSTSPWWSIVPGSFVILVIILSMYVYNSRRKAKKNPFGNHNEDDNQLNQPMMIPMMTRPQCGGPMQNNHYNHNPPYHHAHYGQLQQQGMEQSFYSRDTDPTGIKIDLNNVELLEVLGQGRFGIVHRALIKDVEKLGQQDNNNGGTNINGETQKEIAVKVIMADEHQSWLNERFVYQSPKMRHPNILNYYYSDKHVQSNNYWLLVEYAHCGSLCSYMKENYIQWKDFLNIALGIVRGLNQMHDAGIAHRDFKSTNVLLKQDLTPCITDFGVAKIFDSPNGSHQITKESYFKVGTPRYMAPEVLEGNIVFTKGSILKIDVYASSLVLWELLSCTLLPEIWLNNAEDHHHQSSLPLLANGNKSRPTGDELRSMVRDYVPPPFKMAFEDVVGSNPCVERMKQVVVLEKQRPPLLKEWQIYPRLNDLCKSVLVEGWDSDHDSRITASCLLERVTFFVDQERSSLSEQSEQPSKELVDTRRRRRSKQQ